MDPGACAGARVSDGADADAVPGARQRAPAYCAVKKEREGEGGRTRVRGPRRAHQQCRRRGRTLADDAADDGQGTRGCGRRGVADLRAETAAEGRARGDRGEPLHPRLARAVAPAWRTSSGKAQSSERHPLETQCFLHFLHSPRVEPCSFDSPKMAQVRKV